MKKIYFILVFLTNIFIYNSSFGEEKYVLLNLLSGNMIENNLPNNEFMTIETRQNKENLILTKNQCMSLSISMIKNIGNLYDKGDLEYYGNGVYNFRGAFGRIVCIEYNKLKEYINLDKKVNPFNFNLEKYIPYIVKEEDIKNYTIFPLMENQKEARKLSDKLNREIKKELEKNK